MGRVGEREREREGEKEILPGDGWCQSSPIYKKQIGSSYPPRKLWVRVSTVFRFIKTNLFFTLQLSSVLAQCMCVSSCVGQGRLPEEGYGGTLGSLSRVEYDGELCCKERAIFAYRRPRKLSVLPQQNHENAQN